MIQGINQQIIDRISTTLGGDFAFGNQWRDVPIRHDIFRDEIWVYNRVFSRREWILGKMCVYILVKEFPDREDSLSLEWCTIDLLNHIDIYSTTSEFRDVVNDLAAAIRQNLLDYSFLMNLAWRFGNSRAKGYMDRLFVCGIRVEYLGSTYYCQPNLSTCYLFDRAEDIGNPDKAVCCVSKAVLRKSTILMRGEALGRRKTSMSESSEQECDSENSR